MFNELKYETSQVFVNPHTFEMQKQRDLFVKIPTKVGSTVRYNSW